MNEFEKLTTAELDVILREELNKDAPDREKVLALLNELEARDPTNSEKRPDGIIEEYTEVRNNYQFIKESPDCSKTKHKVKRWIGPIAAAAVVAVVLIVIVPQTAGAQNIFEIIGRWTADLFKLSEADKPEESIQDEYKFETENEGLQQLYDAVTEQGVTEPIVPMWLPDGYELKELKTFTTLKVPKIHAFFAKEEQYLQISIEIHSSEATNKYPKDNTNVPIYESGGVFYYIAPNEDTWKAIWTNGNVECAIITNDTEDVLYDVIKTIQGRIK